VQRKKTNLSELQLRALLFYFIPAAAMELGPWMWMKQVKTVKKLQFLLCGIESIHYPIAIRPTMQFQNY